MTENYQRHTLKAFLHEMSKTLVVSATGAEIAPFLTNYNISPESGLLAAHGREDLFVLITGAGMVKTAFELGKLMGAHFDLVINAGIAGCFTGFRPGDVVNVTQDCFSEMGAEDDQKFIPIDKLGLGEQNIRPNHPYSNLVISKLPVTNGITVNTVHGNEMSIARITEKYQPHIETMEGAAFFLAANGFNWRCVQLRAISNMVTKRNRNAWQIDLAVKNLNDILVALVESVSLSGTR